MRSIANAEKVRRLLEELGRRAQGPGTVYIAGGASALLVGWRDTTVDVDLKLEPEPEGIFAAIAALKNELDVNVELASPDQFVPPPPDWKAHSRFISRYGSVDFYHFDFRAQALAKLARGHDRDLKDVSAMLARNLISIKDLREVFRLIDPNLVRYPAIDAQAFRERVESFLAQGEQDGDV